MTHAKKALILGATGGIGGEMAAALSRHGWQITALHRNPAKADERNRPSGPAVDQPHPPITWVQGDAMYPADVTKAAQGTSL